MFRRPLLRWIWGTILVLLTGLNWHYRFEAAPHPVSEQTLRALVKNDPQNAKNRGLEVIETNEGNLIRLEKKKGQKIHSSLAFPFPDSADCRAVLISFDYRYKDVIQGDHSYLLARGVFSDRGEERWYHPADSLLFMGHGSKDWTHLEVIRELPETGRESRLHFEMLGDAGRLEIRNFKMLKVSERRWFLSTTITLSLLWVLWIFSIITHRSSPSILRRLGATIILFVVSWLTIFPQTHTLFFPFWGSFDIGEDTPPSSSQSTITEKVAPQKPAQNPRVQEPSTIQEKPITQAKTRPQTPSRQEVTHNKITKVKSNFNNSFRKISHDRRWLHLPAYLLFTFLFLTVTGKARAIGIIITIAVLAETIPPVIRYGFDLSDVIDLTFNLCGIAIGFLCWNRFPRIIKRWKPRQKNACA
ncbi:MAG: hypothetical protein ABF332_05170 [Akkermansiaceae bacterium]